MTGSTAERRFALAALLPAAALLGLVALIVLVTSGTVPVIGESTLKRYVVHVKEPSPSASQSVDQDPRDRLAREHPPSGLSWIGDLLAWAMLVLLVVVALAGAVWLWRHRPRRAPADELLDIDVLPEVERVARSVGQRAAEQLAGLADGDARNGIVRCWMVLEESVAEAGLPRQRSETSTEFTVRVLHRLDLDPRTVGRLAALYREARFSEHLLGEDARTEARSLVESLHAELRAATGSTA